MFVFVVGVLVSALFFEQEINVKTNAPKNNSFICCWISINLNQEIKCRKFDYNINPIKTEFTIGNNSPGEKYENQNLLLLNENTLLIAYSVSQTSTQAFIKAVII